MSGVALYEKPFQKSKSIGTPGAYSLLAESFIHRKELSVQKRHSFAPALPMVRLFGFVFLILFPAFCQCNGRFSLLPRLSFAAFSVLCLIDEIKEEQREGVD